MLSKWRKQGLIYTPTEHPPWMISHASNPTVEHIENSLHRVYFGCRDAANRGSIASFDFDLADPSQVFNRSQAPIVSPGSIGTFDDSGISMGSIVRLEDGRRFLYYVGWNLGVTVPWRNSIGLAIAENGSDHFDRYSLAPILDRNQIDPYSLSYPWIVRVRPNEWLMYYGSNLNWGKTENDMKHVIKIASSRDGISWIRDGEIAIALASPEEIGISRPCVVKDDNLFKMWYSYRAGAYRIGYAESLDGHTWKRMDHYAGIDVSESGWDSASISYGCVFDYNGQRYMLYNGNDYGRTGIGLASLAE